MGVQEVHLQLLYRMIAGAGKRTCPPWITAESRQQRCRCVLRPPPNVNIYLIWTLMFLSGRALWTQWNQPSSVDALRASIEAVHTVNRALYTALCIDTSAPLTSLTCFTNHGHRQRMTARAAWQPERTILPIERHPVTRAARTDVSSAYWGAQTAVALACG